MKPVTTDTVPSFSAMLRAALNDQLDPAAETFEDMLAEDAVMEFPYAPPEWVQRLDGRTAVREYLSSLAEILKLEHMATPIVHQTKNPEILILEFAGSGSSVKTGQRYDQMYISVITLRNGYIVHYRDYWNPLIAVALTSGTEKSDEELTGGVS